MIPTVVRCQSCLDAQAKQTEIATIRATDAGDEISWRQPTRAPVTWDEGVPTRPAPTNYRLRMAGNESEFFARWFDAQLREQKKTSRALNAEVVALLMRVVLSVAACVLLFKIYDRISP